MMSSIALRHTRFLFHKIFYPNETRYLSKVRRTPSPVRRKRGPHVLLDPLHIGLSNKTFPHPPVDETLSQKKVYCELYCKQVSDTDFCEVLRAMIRCAEMRWNPCQPWITAHVVEFAHKVGKVLGRRGSEVQIL